MREWRRVAGRHARRRIRRSRLTLRSHPTRRFLRIRLILRPAVRRHARHRARPRPLPRHPRRPQARRVPRAARRVPPAATCLRRPASGSGETPCSQRTNSGAQSTGFKTISSACVGSPAPQKTQTRGAGGATAKTTSGRNATLSAISNGSSAPSTIWVKSSKSARKGSGASVSARKRENWMNCARS